MDFLVYSLARPDIAEADDDSALDERHWSYMDRFADAMTARGPLLGPDGEGWAGSVHIVALPDADAAREFVQHEPYNQVGAYAQHLVWRFDNLLGRTMWQFDGPADLPRWFVVGHAMPRVADGATEDELAAGWGSLQERSRVSPLREEVIVLGALRDPIDGDLVGVALALQAADREALDGWLAAEAGWLGDPSGLQVQRWEFGGRR